MGNKVLLLVFSLLFCACISGGPRREGARLYKMHCENCHLESGQGLGALIPPLAGADYLAARRDRLPCILKYGLKDSIRVNGTDYKEQMAGIPQLNEIQITNILNYIGTQWGNELPLFSPEETRGILEKCQ